jgi:hypothetical protein
MSSWTLPSTILALTLNVSCSLVRHSLREIVDNPVGAEALEL